MTLMVTDVPVLSGIDRNNCISFHATAQRSEIQRYPAMTVIGRKFKFILEVP